MDENGYMQTGWVNVNGDWYYLTASDSMQTGVIVDGGYRRSSPRGRALRTLSVSRAMVLVVLALTNLAFWR